MVSTLGRNNITIYMPIPVDTPNNDPENIGNRTYRFANVSTVRIENITIFFISLNFIGKNSIFEAEHVNFHGYLGFMSPLVSVINVTNSQAVIKDCIFQHNMFIRIQSNAVLRVSNCAFISYSHALYSAVFIDNSTLIITGSVTFINNTVGNDQYYSCGGAISSNPGDLTCEQAARSILSITEAYVYFKSNTASSCGGAFYLRCTVMTAFDNASMTLINNAIKSNYNNYGAGGGAIYLIRSHIIVKNSVIQFLNNSAKGAAHGGAIYQTQSNINISEYGAISFVSNAASSLGGAIYDRDRNVISVSKYSRLLFYNNSASQGGAIYLQLSGIIHVGSNSHVEFSHNTAMKFGGAIYAYDQTCLFIFESSSSTVMFRENFAKEGVGMHVYGASIISKECIQQFLCGKNIVSYIPSLNSSLSPVSSNPKRVCPCDMNAKPQCANISSIFVNWHKVYRGELFNISVVVVGYDFGVTIGTVNAGLVPSQGRSKSSLHPDQYRQFLGGSRHIQCSNVSYSLHSNNSGESLHEALFLHTSSVDTIYFYSTEKIKQMLKYYKDSKHRCIDISLLTTPVLINITLLAGCPPGFTLTLIDQLYGCNCFPVLQYNHFKCFIISNAGYLKWNSTVWVNATFNMHNSSESDGILFAHYCPLDYCKSGEKVINLGKDPNAQCANNHAGVLCGGCQTNYSLAIGSSRCIMCSSDSHLALFIFFLAAGLLLVIFILVLNLTVTKGLINGLVLYANILWTLKDVLFPFKQTLTMNIFQTFIA